jgi:hypothetical protein
MIASSSSDRATVTSPTVSSAGIVNSTPSRPPRGSGEGSESTPPSRLGSVEDSSVEAGLQHLREAR